MIKLRFLLHSCYFKQQFLYFLPLPQGQGSFLPTFVFGVGFEILICSVKLPCGACISSSSFNISIDVEKTVEWYKTDVEEYILRFKNYDLYAEISSSSVYSFSRIELIFSIKLGYFDATLLMILLEIESFVKK